MCHCPRFSIPPVLAEAGCCLRSTASILLSFYQLRVVTKILSCRVNTKSIQAIKQLAGASFGSIFLYFPLKVDGGHVHSSWEKSPAPAS